MLLHIKCISLQSWIETFPPSCVVVPRIHTGEIKNLQEKQSEKNYLNPICLLCYDKTLCKQSILDILSENFSTNTKTLKLKLTPIKKFYSLRIAEKCFYHKITVCCAYKLDLKEKLIYLCNCFTKYVSLNFILWYPKGRINMFPLSFAFMRKVFFEVKHCISSFIFIQDSIQHAFQQNLQFYFGK